MYLVFVLSSWHRTPRTCVTSQQGWEEYLQLFTIKPFNYSQAYAQEVAQEDGPTVWLESQDFQPSPLWNDLISRAYVIGAPPNP